MKHFFPFRFDEATRSLWRDAEALPLTRKAAEVLQCLLDRAGAVVSAREILAVVWPGIHVHPDNVKVLIHELRQALHDDAQRPRFIQSIRGRGYRFLIVPMSSEGTSDREEPGAWQAAALVRRPELSALESAFGTAMRDAVPQVVVIEGERGLGKTTLVDSFARTLTGRARIARGRATEEGGFATPLSPVLEALEDLVRQAPGIALPALRARAPHWLARMPRWHEWVPPDVLEPAGLASMAAELSAALEELSQSAPLVVVLENLQWSDRETISALRTAVGRRVTARVVIVVTLVPAVHAPIAPTISLRLRPFSRETLDEYMAARFGQSSLKRVSPIVAWFSMGHPMLVGKVLHGLIATQCLVNDQDGWHLGGSGSLVRAVLATLPEAYDVHVRQLESDDRVVLEAATAVGRRFTAEAIVTALDGVQAVEAVSDRLTTLTARGALWKVRAGVVRRAPAEYVFRHPAYADAVARQAPLFDLLRATRRVRHFSRDVERLG